MNKSVTRVTLDHRPTFAEYVRYAKTRDSIVNDLLGDLRADERLPEIKRLSALIFYLQSRNACPEALIAARVAWRNYQKHAKNWQV